MRKRSHTCWAPKWPCKVCFTGLTSFKKLLLLLLARFLILFPFLWMLRLMVLRIVVSTEQLFEVFDVRGHLTLGPDLALSPEVHTEEALTRYHNPCIWFIRCTPLFHSHSVLESMSMLERRSSLRCYRRCKFMWKYNHFLRTFGTKVRK